MKNASVDLMISDDLCGKLAAYGVILSITVSPVPAANGQENAQVKEAQAK